MSESKTSVRRLAAAERERRALELRKSGASFPAIARTLGYAHPSGAYRSVMAGLRKTLQEPADDLRQLETSRLDEMLMRLWPQVIAGDHSAMDRVLRIMERRAKYMGLDAAQKAEVSSTVELEVSRLSDEQLFEQAAKLVDRYREQRASSALEAGGAVEPSSRQAGE